MEQDREAAVRARAYQLWEEDGREHGSHRRHWQQAEREVDAGGSAATTPVSLARDGMGTPVSGSAGASAVRDGQPRKPWRVPAAIDEP